MDVILIQISRLRLAFSFHHRNEVRQIMVFKSEYTAVETACGQSIVPVKSFHNSGAWIRCTQCGQIHWGTKTETNFTQNDNE